MNTTLMLLPTGSITATAAIRSRASARDRVILELAIGRVEANAEYYLLTRAARKLKPELLRPTPPASDADPATKRIRDAAKNFPKLVALWRQAPISVNLTALNSWNDFSALRDLRHVLVHQLGNWQPGISKPKPTVAARIQRLGLNPNVYRGSVQIGRRDLFRATTLVVDFIAEADALI